MINKLVGAVGLKPVALSVGLTALSMAAIWSLLAMLGPQWAQFPPATCTATRCFCELPRVGELFVQPANSWSSYGYAFAGFLMIAWSQIGNWQSRFHPLAAAYFGITAIFVGLGSVLLHATLTLWGQFFDVMGMYLTSAFMVVSAIVYWRRWDVSHAVMLYLSVVGILLLILYQFPDARRWLFALVLLSAIVIELVYARPRRTGVNSSFYFAGLATTAFAFAIWNLDQHGALCAPQSLVQGHAIWHVLGATSLWLTFLYYRSERTS